MKGIMTFLIYFSLHRHLQLMMGVINDSPGQVHIVAVLVFDGVQNELG